MGLSKLLLVFSLLLLLFSSLTEAKGLKVGFYAKSCPKAEAIVSKEMKRVMKLAPSLAGPLLRMHFHDCFVNGCDGSVLLNGTSSSPAEKDAIPNLSLRGFGTIDGIKEKLEKACPGIVSCSDIMALVARDVVVLTNGPFWEVPTGRRDGRRSVALDTLRNLPPPVFNFSQILNGFFAPKGLNAKDVIVLSGGHTIGTSHCSSFSNRLYNFTGKGDADPSLDKFYLPKLKEKCKPDDVNTLVEMDPGSFKTFDASYYKNVLKRRVLFTSDQSLLEHSEAKAYLQRQINGSPSEFFKDFGVSMVKMGNIQVLTGNEVLLSLCIFSSAELKLNFYNKSCPMAEKIISDFINEHIPHAPSLAAPLLRMHFHDCFVRGCDASVLINSTSNNEAEKDSPPNKNSLRGFDFIDRVKSLVEAQCPGIVSCADTIALVARDAIRAIGGPTWNVPTGRRDGIASRASEALENIPAPTFNISFLQNFFDRKGLNITDLVLLSGGHTIGISHCSSFSERLYNFSGKGDTDPSLDKLYAENLKKKKCRLSNDSVSFVEMDPGSFRTFDLGYYRNLLKRRGLFQSDAALITNSDTKSFIIELVKNHKKFPRGFALSMEKMGRIEVKTGFEGEIRKNCAVINN
ncbi:hypothetical protein IEQ34_026419 [Dendrobium chrysotoxum]|uniref:Peroxidase 1 n=1 Tax=Dendrobium chrysotoxum TaxID=161865 RepID=A0AAV7FLN4_DENCH|nr:hypothetical protein IEQ34_026419 [Dendrobium chrysotoxum]